MNIFFVGNGFDLHHKFPTGYINFMHVMQLLVESKDEEYSTVGSVLGSKLLHEKDAFVKECYDRHVNIYGLTELSPNIVKDLVERAKDNMWFNYFSNCITEDINWIDFEKEIIRVLIAFENFFDYGNNLKLIKDRVEFNFSSFPVNVVDRHILSQFDFFFEEAEPKWAGETRMMDIKKKYIKEEVAGAKSYELVKEEIVSDLYLNLREFADILRDYLLWFVDNPANRYLEFGIKPIFQGMPTPNRVYSFNYTNIFEYLYENPMVDHIHGNTATNIVLGINPDEKDEGYNIDTTFLQFKKYFQRVFFKTDDSFLSNMADKKIFRIDRDDHLWVIGHSLDSTDEDVIKQIFESANKITILYHKESVVKDYITHLVEIYGKESLDRLREEKGLTFMKQAEIYWKYPGSN